MKYITVDSKNAYCIDFGTQLGTYTNETDDHAQTLLSYLTDNGLTEAVAKDAVNKVMLYNYFGYNSGVKGRNTYQYYLATQQLIWETLNDTGFFKSPNTIKNDLMDNQFKGGYDISNIRFLKTSTDSHNRCSENLIMMKIVQLMLMILNKVLLMLQKILVEFLHLLMIRLVRLK